MSWTGQAESLTEAAIEAGEATAEVVAAAWRARVDPRATDGLAGAALALFAPPSALLSGGVVPLPSDAEMLAQGADLETCVANLLNQARALSDQVTSALEVACAAAAAALVACKEAKDRSQSAAAQRALEQAQREIADCEQALEILVETGERLNYALGCLTRVPDDLVCAYEPVYDWLRHDAGRQQEPRRLPWSGDFIQGVPA